MVPTNNTQGTLAVSEIFYSIQGESSYSGRPCIFVRLAGCNLRCSYCDAQYTWNEGTQQSLASILEEVEKYPASLVELTGGEPLFQESCYPLMDALLRIKKKVLLESNGSLSIERVPIDVIAILDVKCPDSGSADSFFPGNIALIEQRLADLPGSCELKFVLSSHSDYLWAKEFIKNHALLNRLPILFSPVQPHIAPDDLAQWLLQDGLNVQLQLQLHSILWPNISRGV
jgi:7-carboxy-7-deazaguanine synthase